MILNTTLQGNKNDTIHYDAFNNQSLNMIKQLDKEIKINAVLPFSVLYPHSIAQ